MKIKKLNHLLEKVLKEDTKTKNIIEFGSFHSNPEKIYFNVNPELSDSFNNRDFDNGDDCKLDGNLIYLTANDEYIKVRNTPYKTKNDFIKALKDTYTKAKEFYDEDGIVEIGSYIEQPEVWNYIDLSLEDEYDDEVMENQGNFCDYIIGWFDETYIDKDSNSVRCLIDPKTFDIVLGGSVDLFQYGSNERDEEDYDESFKSKKSNKKKLKEEKQGIFTKDINVLRELVKTFGDNITLKDLLHKLSKKD